VNLQSFLAATRHCGFAAGWAPDSLHFSRLLGCVQIYIRGVKYVELYVTGQGLVLTSGRL
jgi:hypothetical protein